MMTPMQYTGRLPMEYIGSSKVTKRDIEEIAVLEKMVEADLKKYRM